MIPVRSIRLSALTILAACLLGQASLAATTLRINFSPDTVDPPQGYQRDSGQSFDATRGYGWDVAVPTRERSGPADVLDRTLAFTDHVRTWSALVPNGDYMLDLRAGDVAFAQGPMSISIDGTPLIDGQSTTAGELIDASARIEVRNGVIALRVGNTNTVATTTINLLEAVKQLDGPVGLTSISFQPVGTDTPVGYRVDTGAGATNPDPGWDIAVDSRARDRIPGAEDSFVFSAAPRTYSEDAENGFYDVWFSLGDPRFAQGPQRVVVEGIVAADDVTTTPPEPARFHALVEVTDGRLDVTIGGAGGNTALSQLTYAKADPDLDADGVLNGDDNCVFDANADQLDTDADGTGDACDPCPADAADDADADGVCVPADNCPLTPNPDQLDADADGAGDACDPCPQDAADDADTDGLCADVDNCPAVANVDQLDGDGDGEGDVCDDDRDGDTVDNDTDNCPSIPNGSQGDVDADGTGDACEAFGVNHAPSGTEALPGYLLDSGKKYTTTRGYGWERSISTRDRGAAPYPGADVTNRLEDSFVFTRGARAFTLELANGDYDVLVRAGDRGYAQGEHRVLVNGLVALNGETTTRDEFAVATVRVPVRNGRLSLDIGGFGGQARTTLNSIHATAVPDGVLPSDMVSINFQTGGADTPEGYVADSGQPYDPGPGRGWNVAVGSRERNVDVPQTRDTLVFSRAPRVFELALAPGTYEVLVEVGDPAYAQSNQRVVVEGVELINGSGTAKNEFLELTTTVQVNDGRLTMEIGGTPTTTVVNQLVVVPVADPD